MRRIMIMAVAAALHSAAVYAGHNGIDRHALVSRNSPHIVAADSLGSLSVGNGNIKEMQSETVMKESSL